MSKRKRISRTACVTVTGLIMTFILMVLACFLPGNDDARRADCPVNDVQLNGYCSLHRSDGYITRDASRMTYPVFIYPRLY
jgi:hypothetical protein